MKIWAGTAAALGKRGCRDTCPGQRRFSGRFASLAATLALLSGCADQGDEPTHGGPPVATVSYATDVQPIFNTDCAGCHTNGGANGGLDLSEGVSHAHLVGIPSPSFGTVRVVAGEPDSSFLYQKLTGNQSDGSPMPPTGLLPADKQELVRVWIEEGALDN